ncbi:hypothetical protein H6F47_22240 [Sphaerospermopsis sp. FACHB-1094]|uniref:hypothetical protein n=1 Tax=Sphaerospermopsis sp. FACHB-1094 TaxID=2692861 RepID=UPI0016842C53|nr:hypothetical protein [Sphaerospermopsis sp. FACHB-1094]MBD2135059.1 hypothetical protein [Sphaerospermopsis sp. FACHB-1094]
MQLIENNVLFTQIDAEESVAANGGTLSDLLDKIQESLPDLPPDVIRQFFEPGS